MTLGDRGPAGGSSIVARRRLGIALRALREEAGKTGEQAAQALTRTGSWISRLEAGRVGVRLPELRALLDIYGLDDIARRRELERLAADTVRRGRGWWSRYAQSIPESYATYIGLEDQAKSLLIYEDRVVPGLLQTAAYGRAIFEVALPPVDGDDANARVQVRLERQQILARPNPPTLNVVMNETALRYAMGSPEVHRAQLEHLLEALRRPFIDVRIRPSSLGPLVVFHSFTVLTFEDDPSLVHVESPAGGLQLEGKEVVERYRETFSRLQTLALDRTRSADLIREILDDFNDGSETYPTTR